MIRTLVHTFVGFFNKLRRTKYNLTILLKIIKKKQLKSPNDERVVTLKVIQRCSKQIYHQFKKNVFIVTSFDRKKYCN